MLHGTHSVRKTEKTKRHTVNSLIATTSRKRPLCCTPRVVAYDRLDCNYPIAKTQGWLYSLGGTFGNIFTLFLTSIQYWGHLCQVQWTILLKHLAEYYRVDERSTKTCCLDCLLGRLSSDVFDRRTSTGRVKTFTNTNLVASRRIKLTSGWGASLKNFAA